MKQLILLTVSLVLGISVFAQGDDPLASSIDSIFRDYENQPGCAVAIVKDGKTVFQKGYGLAHLSYDIPVTTQTLFEVASNAQQFTAACIFLLAEEDLLSLNDPIRKYLPEIPEYEGGPITISHLLYHTSGLRSFYATLHAKNIFWGDSHTNEDALEVIARHKRLNFPPGTQHYFSNSNYILLASIVEKVSGKSIGRYAKEKLFDPLGMTHTFYKEEKGTLIKNGAIGYEPEGDAFKELHSHNSSVVGHGGVYTHLEDFIKWSNYLSSGTIGGGTLPDKLITPGTLSDGTEIECTGGLFMIDHNAIEDLPVVVHRADWAGFRSFYYQFIDQDVAFIILSNNANTYGWGLIDQLVPLFMAEEIASAEQAQHDTHSPTSIQPYILSKTEKEKFCAKYYSTLNGYLREIKLEGDQLMYIRPGAPPTPLMAISAHELVYETMPHVKFTFNQNSKSCMVVTINERSPMPYEKYEPHSYSPSELKPFENRYYNEDMDVVYQLIAHENELQIWVGGEEVVSMNPISEDLFTSEHSGYLKFNRDPQGKVIGFTQYDDHLYNLPFEVVKKESSKSGMGQNSEYENIKGVLMDYIEGTAHGEPERVRRAFHEDLNLYSVKNDTLAVWYGKDYVGGITPGKKNNRQGKILSIDYEKDAATAKVEIKIPNWRIFTDYFLLLKIEGKWKIIHKSFTWRNLAKEN